MRITDMITKMNLLDILLTSPHYSVVNEYGRQMIILILISRFKGLNRCVKYHQTDEWQMLFLMRRC